MLIVEIVKVLVILILGGVACRYLSIISEDIGYMTVLKQTEIAHKKMPVPPTKTERKAIEALQELRDLLEDIR